MSEVSIEKLQRKRKHWLQLHILTILCATALVAYCWYEASLGLSVRMGYVVILIAFQVFSLQQIQIWGRRLQEHTGEPTREGRVTEALPRKLTRMLFALLIVLGAPATVILSFVYFYRLLMKVGTPEATYMLGAYMIGACYLICLSVSVISLLPVKPKKAS